MNRVSIFLSLALACVGTLLTAQTRDFAPEAITCTSTVNCSAEDANFLYLGTNGGLLQVNKVTQAQFLFHIANSGLGSNQITALAFDQDHILWVGTNRAGLYSWDGNAWQGHNDFLFAHGVFAIPKLCVDSNNQLWMSAWHNNNSALLKYDGVNWTEYTSTNSILPIYPIVDVAAGPNGEIWALSYYYFEQYVPGEGWYMYSYAYLSCVSANEVVAYDIHNGPPYIPTSPYTSLTNVEVDSTGKVWLLEYHYGSGSVLRLLDDGVWSVVQISDLVGTVFILRDIAFGANDTLWLLSQTQLAMVPSNLTNPTLYNVTGIDHIPDRILSVQQNNLTFGVLQQSLTEMGYICFRDNLFSDHSSALNPLVDLETIETFAVDLAGNLWVSGNIDQGVFRWNGQAWAQFHTQNSPLSSNAISSIYADPTGGVWIGTVGHLTRVVNENWTTFDCEASGLWHPKMMVRGPDNMLHVVDNDLIYTWDITNQTGQVYLSVDNDLLPSPYIQDIAVDTYNRKWIATAAGLVRWLGNDVDLITTPYPFTSCNFTALARDGDYLWIANNIGQVARLFVNDFQLQDFSAFGDPPHSISDLAVDADHSVWIANSNGPLYHWANGELHSTDTLGHALTHCGRTNLAIGPDGTKWLNMYYNGIITFNGQIVPNSDPTFNMATAPVFSNRPNPFTAGTTLTFRSQEAGPLSLRIYNLRGQLLRATDIDAARYEDVNWYWDGKDSKGQKVAAGIYLAQVTGPDFRIRRRMLLVK